MPRGKKSSSCRAMLSRKISKIHHEGLRGKKPGSAQAVAAAANIVRKNHPECARVLRRGGNN